MIYFPRFLLHKVAVLPRKNAAAFHLGPLGIWYTDKTRPEMLEQEKAEAWWVTISLCLSVLAAAVLPGWYALFGIVPFGLYPGCYYVKYPGSVHLRRYFETTSHAIEFRYWRRSNYTTGTERRDWISDRAWMMCRHKFYDLKWKYSETREALAKRCLT